MANRGTNKIGRSRSGDDGGGERATKQKDPKSTQGHGRTSSNTDSSGRTNAGGADASGESKVLGEP